MSIALLNLYIKPFQWHPKIKVFLEALIDSTPQCHSDYEKLREAVLGIESEIQSIEGQYQKYDSYQTLKELEHRLEPKYSIFTSTRMLNFSEKIRIISPISSQGFIYLFNDIIFFTTSYENKEKPLCKIKRNRFSFSIDSLQLGTISFAAPIIETQTQSKFC